VHHPSKQSTLMGLIFGLFAVLYCLPFQKALIQTSLSLAILFPVQTVLWRLGLNSKTRDYFFAVTTLVTYFFLKHLWANSDLFFYLFSILLAAVLSYRIFLASCSSMFLLEGVREYVYQSERPEDIAFRYALFFAAGTLTYLLLRDEKKRKEEYREQLFDLKFAMEMLEDKETPVGQTARKVDAAIALDRFLRETMENIQRVYKPETTLLWLYLADRKQLRLQQQAGNSQDLKSNQIVALGEGPVGWTALNRKVFLQQDREDGVQISLYNKARKTLSFLAVPILNGDRLEAVITLDSFSPAYFPSEAVTAIETFAAQISENIRMARLAKDQEETNVRSKSLRRAGKELSEESDFEKIVKKLPGLCREITKFDFSAVTILDGEQGTYSLFEWADEQEQPGSGRMIGNKRRTWISWFMTNCEEPLIISRNQLRLQGMPVLRGDEELDELSSFLAIPLRYQQKPIGALLLGSEENEAFSSHDAGVLAILGFQAGVSLENAANSNSDGLTSLLNHRHFKKKLEEEIERAERQKQPLTLMMMDIDHFKGFNDTFGHPAGDFILRGLAALLKKNARNIDVLARYGGEEFAALLPGIDAKNGKKTAERWRKAVQRSTFKWDGRNLSVTLSIGLATYPDDVKVEPENFRNDDAARIKARENHQEELITRADKALYEAKENGRNQVRQWGERKATGSRLFG
jgi:two-component system cell cycle response regulator